MAAIDRPYSAIQLEQGMAAAVDAAQAAGRFLMDQLGRVSVREKAPRDLVTQADCGSQDLIERALLSRFSDHRVLGEEHATAIDWRQGMCWVVDPLDGTTNFVHGLPGYSVSIALCCDGQPIVGVVHDPWLKETYTATVHEPARLNGQSIEPSRCRELERALMVSSFPSTVTPESAELIRFNRVVLRATTRRLGSAALNFCYVAAGRLDGYWSSTLKIWDVAAGVLIARRAGAVCCHLSGSALDLADPQILSVATPELAQSLIPMLDVDHA